MEIATIHVYGMTCDHCEESVKNALLKVDGVSAVTVSYQNRTAEVQYEASEVSMEELQKAIESQGYEVA
ncbi:heavy-metal-associated domain-containing protein [Mesobacillus foraminis]|uniref:heavy-metal-associated domain-containing protein n=1 Tax=Mesobacillus foraminis TaxID=279826 RepID=UPI001BEB0D55|nr:cation transporter [Mesobacillus foraminis]MBT2757153.1 heavy-metal-associated domain-containing protein [Mesobacillus foraminis]